MKLWIVFVIPRELLLIPLSLIPMDSFNPTEPVKAYITSIFHHRQHKINELQFH